MPTDVLAPQTAKLSDAPFWPIIVIGGGAAGLMAGLFAARAGVRVLILETKRRPGTKIRISGGGRCNVLPSEATTDDFVSEGSVHTLRNILSAWPRAEVAAFFEADLGVPLKREATGKLFPKSDRAQDVIDALVAAITHAGGTLRTDARVKRLGPAQAAPRASGEPAFLLEMASGERLSAAQVIVATGGLSVPGTGSDGAGMRMACQMGHSMQPTSPALVPLLSQAKDLSALAGLACPATLSAVVGGKSLGCMSGDFLFTHRGFSGPAVLNISRHVTAPKAHGMVTGAAQVEVQVRWPVPEGTSSWAQALAHAAGTMLAGTFVRQHLPKRLGDMLLCRAGIRTDVRLGDLRRVERQALLAQLDHFVLPISGDEGYRTAEVTAGGVTLSEVHTKTLESRLQPGLYIVGEALDVIGALGGYNFLWAWVTGRRAGQAAGRRQAKLDESAGLCAQNPGAQSAA